MVKKSVRKAARQAASNPDMLLLSYFYPPTAGGGVFRPLAMSKYLSRLNWNITVLTATTPKHYPTDPALGEQIPEKVEIIRRKVVWEGKPVRRALGKVKLDWIARHLITPDERVFWAEKATTKAKKLLKKRDISLIYTTGPPFSINLAGLWLKRMVNLPWVAEFRDPWTLAPYLSIPNAHHRRFAEETETDIVERADAIVMATPTFTNLMKEKYSDHADKIFCVQNGFDMEEFLEFRDFKKPESDEFRITASGTVFGRNNMNDFLTGLERLKEEHPEIYSELRVTFQGLPDERLNQRLLENDLTDRCISRGFVDHRENIKDLLSSDLLILPLAKVLNSKGHIPSRTYEYLAAGTPVLATCPDGDLADLLKKFPQVTRVGAKDPDAVYNAMIGLYENWRDGKSVESRAIEDISEYTRESRAVEMDKILRDILPSDEDAK